MTLVDQRIKFGGDPYLARTLVDARVAAAEHHFLALGWSQQVADAIRNLNTPSFNIIVGIGIGKLLAELTTDQAKDYRPGVSFRRARLDNNDRVQLGDAPMQGHAILVEPTMPSVEKLTDTVLGIRALGATINTVVAIDKLFPEPNTQDALRQLGVRAYSVYGPVDEPV